MALKTDRLETRLSPTDRAHIERAAAAAGTSVSAFVVNAALERAHEVIATATTTVARDVYFDALVLELDQAAAAPTLRSAAQRARRRPRIAE